MQQEDSPEPKKTPDELVEGKILIKLKSSKCATDSTIKALEGKLAQGTLKSEDWAFIFNNQLSASKVPTNEA